MYLRLYACKLIPMHADTSHLRYIYGQVRERYHMVNGSLDISIDSVRLLKAAFWFKNSVCAPQFKCRVG